MLPYPPTGAFTWDVVFLFLYMIIERTRLFQGKIAAASALIAAASHTAAITALQRQGPRATQPSSEHHWCWR